MNATCSRLPAFAAAFLPFGLLFFRLPAARFLRLGVLGATAAAAATAEVLFASGGTSTNSVSDWSEGKLARAVAE